MQCSMIAEGMTAQAVSAEIFEKELTMRGLGMTLARLAASNRAMPSSIGNDDGRLGELRGFGTNPGDLRALTYLPKGLPDNAPLVVVLHGCTQNASTYDEGSGWSQLAEEHGFALLFPEQRRSNNGNLCFNWYEPRDARRGKGEALSICQMVKHITATHRLDPSRTYVTGLSAGGAMTTVMLATYPELFAGGAVIAGLPFASANSLPEALERMRGHGSPLRHELAARAQTASPRSGRGPTLSVWHGTRDFIVNPANADVIVDQWLDLNGLGSSVGHVETIDGHRREVWRDDEGRDLIEKYDVQGMGHGTPLDTRGSDACGTAGPHMLEANICSTRRIAAFWGLVEEPSASRGPGGAHVALVPEPEAESTPAVIGVHAVIENALRAAGLMP